MAEKTTTAPLDRLALAEWRQGFAVFLGKSAWTDLPSVLQTEIEIFLNEEHEAVYQRARGQPWGQREQSSQTVTAGTDTTYDMPVDFRSHIWIVEESSARKIVCNVTDKETFGKRHQGGSDHPWASSATPFWFFNHMTDDTDTPGPLQNWRRVGSDNTGATIRILYQPYLALLNTSGSDQFTILPASERKSIRYGLFEVYSDFSKDLERGQYFAAKREKVIAEADANRQDTDEPVQQGFDEHFTRQMG